MQQKTPSPTILLIDHDSITCNLLEHFLKNNGYQVIAAQNGGEAERAAIACDPNLILVDPNLPGVDGYEMIERIRKMKAVPMIVMFKEAQRDAIERAAKIGVEEVVLKASFSSDGLLDKIRFYLGTIEKPADPNEPVAKPRRGSDMSAESSDETLASR